MKRIFAWILAIASVLCTVCFAFAEDGVHCFATEEFSQTAGDGILIASVPAQTEATLLLGNRILRPGDVLTADQLSAVRMISNGSKEAVMSFRSVEDGHVAPLRAMTVALFPKEDQPPVAEDSALETYRNIANTGELKASDPENGTLTYTLVNPPKRGTAELSEDGTFLYTPLKNKVGSDSFTYTATDEAGNTSPEATVQIKILKPADKTAYSDMEGDRDQFTAMWMRESGLLTGETVAGNPCFCPEKSVTRGEFLVMSMLLTGSEPTFSELSTGFHDEPETPAWMQPYLATALKNGLITGVDDGTGLVFRPTANVTKAEAAVILQNALDLPVPGDRSVFAMENVPVWAESSLSALACAGISMEPGKSTETLTRREAARLLYKVAQLLEESKSSFISWN